MVIAAFLILLSVTNEEFFKMVDSQQKLGYNWEYVGRTEVTNELALPAKEEDGTLVYYFYLTEPENGK